jgi:hypothetical protein
MHDVNAQFSKVRASRSLMILADELERQFGEDYEIVRNFGGGAKAPITVRRKSDGHECLIDIHSPIAPAIPVYGTVLGLAVVVDDLRVRRHLGEEVEKVAAAL